MQPAPTHSNRVTAQDRRGRTSPRCRLARSALVRRSVMVLVAGVLAAGVLPGSAGAHEAGTVVTDGLLYQNCHELLSFHDVPLDNVDPHVPDRYGLDHDNDGDASFYLSTRRCEKITVNGVDVRDAIDSHISVFVIPPEDEPDPPHASSLAPGIPLDVYPVQWVTNNAAHAAWMKQNTSLGKQVEVVHDLRFGIDQDTVTVLAPRPAPSPFHIDATVHGPLGCPWMPTASGYACPIPGFLAENWWADTRKGTVILHAEAPNGATVSLPARTDGTTTSDEPDSPLGRMFGSEDQQTRPLCSDVNGNPCLPGGIGDPIGFSFFSAVQLTKCVRTHPNECLSHE